MMLNRRRMMLMNGQEEDEMKEVTCNELLYEGEEKAGNLVNIKTGITYADLKKYARVAIMQLMSANDPITNNCIGLGEKTIGRTSQSGMVVLLDLRNESYIEPWCAYSNTTLIADVPSKWSINYPQNISRSMCDIEKSTVSDADEITFYNLVGDKLKVDTKFYIYGITKYV